MIKEANAQGFGIRHDSALRPMQYRQPYQSIATQNFRVISTLPACGLWVEMMLMRVATRFGGAEIAPIGMADFES